MIKNSIIEQANKKYIRRNTYKRYAYRIPYLILYIVATNPLRIGGLVTLLVYASISEFLIMALTKREKNIEKKIRNGDYILKEDIVKDIYTKDIDSQRPELGSIEYMSFKETMVAYSHNNLNLTYDIGKKVVLQIVVVKNKEEIINVFKLEEE